MKRKSTKLKKSKWTFSRKLCLGLMACIISLPVFSQFVHPGISHNLSDLDRMKYMVEAGIEPWATTFQNLSNHGRAQYDYSVGVVNQDPSYVTEFSAASDAWFNNDGTAAYYNALMWYITGDSRHADKAVEIFNTWKGLVRNTTGIPLESGRVWRIIEAAEIIEHTYNGWAAPDIQDFKDMLVYPGYSSTTVPTAAINSNDITFYWKVYQGDPARHGNQGLFCMRTMMAMAIFLDNEIMYDRALRYLQGQSHRSDDLAYPSGPSINGTTNISACNYFEEYSRTGQSTSITDYGYNEVMSNYIYENGQSQESSRDQAHAIAGVSTIAVMAEMAWNQSDDLYGHLNNRPLLGMEFYYRYNLSYQNSYPDQTSPWEPTVASGEYIERTDRSGRWKSLEINPFLVCGTGIERGQHSLQPIYEMNLGHYRDRLNLPNNDYKWLERGHAYLTSQIGVEGEGTVTDHPGYGGLKFRRVSPGDPISGFDNNGLPIYEMNVLPMTIEAENFDYFATSGEDRVYNDTGSGNTGGDYRTDENVDIQVASEGGYNIGWIAAGEYLTYTVYVPSDGNYDISVKYASPNFNGQIKVSFDGVDQTGNVSLSNTSDYQIYQDAVLAQDVYLTQGVKSMRVDMVSSGFNFNSITIGDLPTGCTESNLALCGTADQSSDRPSDGFAEEAIDGDTNGAWAGGSVTHTLSETNPWWEVTLDDTYTIGDINIFGRTDGCCIARLSNFTVSVLDGNSTTYSETFTSYPDPSVTANANGATGNKVRVQLNGTNALSLAEVQVYEGQPSGPTQPVAGKTYYIDNPYWNLRLSADGDPNPDTAPTSTTGANVEWTVTASPTSNFFYVDCNGGGSVPRIRTDRTENADMQATTSAGTWTRWEFTDAGNGAFFMTTLDDTNYERLQINSSSQVKMVSDASAGTWETFTFTEVLNPSGREANEGDVNTELNSKATIIYPNPAINQLTMLMPESEYDLFEIYDFAGKMVRQGVIRNHVTELSIDLGSLERGIYLLTLSGDQANQTFKLIKQ